jgi:mono/diheme cytochrome c family protein
MGNAPSPVFWGMINSMMNISSKVSALFVILAVSVFISCSKPAAVNVTVEKQTYNSVGVIKKLDATAGKVTLDHQDIPGYMSAMVMSYTVAQPNLMDGLEVGDQVSFVLERTGENVAIARMTKVEGMARVDGAQIFAASCSDCHGAKGEGDKKGIPLTSGHAVTHSEEEYVKQVMQGTPKKMPAFKDKLTPEQIAAVVKYLRTEIQAGVTPEQREHHH